MSQHALTVISHGPTIPASVIKAVEEFTLETLKLEFSTVKTSPRSIDILVEVEDSEAFLDKVKQFSNSQQSYDVIFQKENQRRNKKLFVFDMDSTLIYQEVIELIAAQADIEEKVAEITERAMNGELDFNESLKERVGLLKGIDATTLWDTLKKQIKITKGAVELCKNLKEQGVTLAVCSGGFIQLAEYVKEQLGLDYAYANLLGVDSDNKLDGTTIGPIVNGTRKAELLLEIAARHGIDPQYAVAVGDGANDLPMMEAAGFGVAWNAKPKVKDQAPSSLNSDSLRDILYILGHRE